jgi:hypothetical protein
VHARRAGAFVGSKGRLRSNAKNHDDEEHCSHQTKGKQQRDPPEIPIIRLLVQILTRAKTLAPLSCTIWGWMNVTQKRTFGSKRRQ